MSNIVTIKKETIKCPVCSIGDITVTIKSEFYSYKAARAFGKVKQIPLYHPEQIKVESNCPNCKAKKSDIKDALERGSGKKMSHEEFIKSIQKRGLPTIIKSGGGEEHEQ